MEKYKVCPSCETKNPLNMMECSNCEIDITGVKVVDKNSETMAVKDSVPERLPSDLVRLCDCGTQNSLQARKCESCSEDISDISPIQLNCEVSYSLTSVDGTYVFDVKYPLHIIGREGDMSEYLMGKSYVSRQQAKISLVQNELYITNESKTNFTYVNNEKLEDGIPRILKEGDEIGLGGNNVNGRYQDKAAYFVVKKIPC